MLFVSYNRLSVGRLNASRCGQADESKNIPYTICRPYFQNGV